MELCSDWDDCYFALVHFISVFIVPSIIIGVTSLIGILTLVPWFIHFAKMAARQLQILSYMFRKPPKVDPNQHGGTLVAKVLKSHGVDVVFTLSGGHISPVLVGAEQLGIRIIDTRHEVNAVFAADAVGRITNKPGVAVVTAGPGLTNTVTAVKNAQMAESPVVLIGGSPATLLRGRGALQDIDHMSVFKSITKWQASPATVRDLVPTMREAFHQAQSGTPGPVFVELALDTLYQQAIVEKEFLVKTGGPGLTAKIMTKYLKAYASNLFAGAFDSEPDVSPLKVDVPLPSPSDVKSAADLLKSAKRPLILLGAQAPIPPVGAEALSSIIQSLGIPCYLGSMSRGLLGPSSPLQMRQARKDALKEADVVLLGGIVADFRLGYGSALSGKSKIISINRDKGQLNKNAHIFWKPTLSIQSDVASFFKSLQSELGSNFSPPSEWIEKLRARDRTKEAKDQEKAKSKADKYLNPVKVLHELDKALPENTYLVADGGDFVATASYIVRPKGPLMWLDPGAFGTLGSASFALGIKAVKPDANVVIIYGDGSVGYTLMEFDTMVRHNLPVTAIVGNDACWTQIVREQVPLLGSPVACNLAFSDYHKVAEALGGHGIKLDDKDNDSLKESFEKAFQLTKQTKKPTLVNVLIGKTDFRAGSVSV